MQNEMRCDEMRIEREWKNAGILMQHQHQRRMQLNPIKINNVKAKSITSIVNAKEFVRIASNKFRAATQRWMGC